jgi:osmoprotectant transport system ATP-binding protein
MTHPIIRFDKVRKEFPNGTVGVNDVSLDIAGNEFFALLGPSVCSRALSDPPAAASGLMGRT